jgi:hypothetical protein
MIAAWTAVAMVLAAAPGGGRRQVEPADNLGLDDGAFWRKVKPRREADPAEGLVLAAPARVAPDQRQSLPVLLRRTASAQEDGRFPLATHAVVVAIDVDRNELFSGGAAVADNAAAPPPIAGAAPAVEGTLTRYEWTELREQVHLPWRPAQLVVVALLRERASNPRRVHLDGAVAEDPARGAEADSTVVDPGVDLAPPPPERRGIALAAGPGTLEGQPLDSVVRGSFRLPHQGAVPSPSEGGRRVRIHLVVTDLGSGASRRLSLSAPASGAEREGELAAGRFALDLRAAARLGPGSYVVRAFWRDVMSGPATFTTAAQSR